MQISSASNRERTQEQLAVASGVSRVKIAAVEAFHKRGSVATLKKLMVVLKCEFGNLA